MGEAVTKEWLLNNEKDTRIPLAFPETELLLYLLGCALNRITPAKDPLAGGDEEELFRAAKGHHVAAMTGALIVENGFGSEKLKPAWENARDLAVYRDILLGEEKEAIEKLLEENGIPFLCLKGSTIQETYPKPGYREVTDIDILIDADRQNDAKQLMLDRGYTWVQNVGARSYSREPLYVVELHEELIPAYVDEKLSAYFADLLERTGLREGKRYQHAISLEDHYVYMVAHGYKHYMTFGIGLRFLCDLYICGREWPLDRAYVEGELRKTGLLDFEQTMTGLARRLLGDPEKLSENIASLTSREKRILGRMADAGAFGTMAQWVRRRISSYDSQSERMTRGIRIRYLLRRVFAPPDILYGQYPFYERHRFLIPVMYIVRVYRLFTSRREFIRDELQALMETSELDPLTVDDEKEGMD